MNDGSVAAQLAAQILPRKKEGTSTMQFQKILLTPELAKQFLDGQPLNRKVSPMLVNKIADDIKNDRFQLTHQSIAVDENGVLRDGQHRCLAVVKAQKAVWTYLSSYDHFNGQINAIDIGSARTAADALEFKGISKSRSTAGICNAAFMAVHVANKRQSLSPAKCLKIYEILAPAIEAITERPLENRTSPSPARLACIFAWFIAPNLATEFYEQFLTGVGLEEGSPALALRRHFLANAAYTAGHKRMIQFRLSAYAIHRFFNGRKVSRLDPVKHNGMPFFESRLSGLFEQIKNA